MKSKSKILFSIVFLIFSIYSANSFAGFWVLIQSKPLPDMTYLCVYQMQGTNVTQAFRSQSICPYGFND